MLDEVTFKTISKIESKDGDLSKLIKRLDRLINYPYPIGVSKFYTLNIHYASTPKDMRSRYQWYSPRDFRELVNLYIQVKEL